MHGRHEAVGSNPTPANMNTIYIYIYIYLYIYIYIYIYKSECVLHGCFYEQERLDEANPQFIFKLMNLSIQSYMKSKNLRTSVASNLNRKCFVSLST